ncbi:MAG TPA: AbrB/MazE/SpoVT family DNA-binding domain-containing protein [Candidatus Nanoarchaeia archaeon]|nr:AbrB/MazE/SpoVT family DNA-binding domain-containing protein [Candidatus Nanoarchaeia archaeon]
MEIKAIAKKWGSSIGVIIPKEVVDDKKIRENDEITIEVKTRPLAGNLFGKFPRKSGISAQKLKDEARRGWLSDSDRERERKWKEMK